jgi:hypothetical protein
MSFLFRPWIALVLVIGGVSSFMTGAAPLGWQQR